MEITEVRIKLTEDSDDRLQAFCSITFDDCFVVRDLKIIEGTNGPFVAMPSRKLTSHCGRCGCKNHLRAAFCNQCGGRLNPDRATRDQDGRAKLYADIAHPVNSKCREQIQLRVIAAFERELELSRQPGYVSRYDDVYEDEFTGADFVEHPQAKGEAAKTPPSPISPQAAHPPAPPVPSLPPPPSPSVLAEIQRTDARTDSPELPAPHLPGSRTSNSAPPTATTPHSHLRPKRSFGAGILDE